MTHLVLEPSPINATAGAGTASGGPGGDLLVAGKCPVALVGGERAGIFVPSRVRATILDDDPAVDRLDL